MIVRREHLLLLSRFAVCVALLITAVSGLTLNNRLILRDNREGYRAAQFLVKDGHFESYSDGTVDYWLTGAIDDADETFHPRFTNASRPRNARDLLSRYPKGSTIGVIYNPGVSDAVISNGEALRIIEASPGFWVDESRRLRWAIIGTLAPLAFAGVLLFVVRRPRLSPADSPAR